MYIKAKNTHFSSALVQFSSFFDLEFALISIGFKAESIYLHNFTS